MKQLTLEQKRFLERVIVLNADTSSTYRNIYSQFTKTVYTNGEYKIGDRVTLNHMRALYLKWKNKNKCK